MDDLTLIRHFRAERADGDPRPRETARLALEARFGTEPAPAPIPGRSRRGVLALAGTAAAAIIAAILILSSGRSAEPAVAEVLRSVATVAADTPPAPQPGPGQLLYGRTKTLELQGWIAGSRRASMGGLIHRPGAFAALVPVERESWVSPEGAGRIRQVMGPPRFFSDPERRRWEDEGSPLPGTFDPSGRSTIFGTDVAVLEARRGVVDVELPEPKGRGLGPNFGFPDVSDLPTEPRALRRAVEERQLAVSAPGAVGAPADAEDTIIGLWGILQQPVIDPDLRAAVFNALAEMPGIDLDRGATDLVGREGYAIGRLDQASGLRNEYIFDPETSVILGERTVITDPGETPGYEGLPAGVTMRESASLAFGVVDSTRETPDGGPVATTGPDYRP